MITGTLMTSGETVWVVCEDSEVEGERVLRPLASCPTEGQAQRYASGQERRRGVTCVVYAAKWFAEEATGHGQKVQV